MTRVSPQVLRFWTTNQRFLMLVLQLLRVWRHLRPVHFRPTLETQERPCCSNCCVIQRSWPSWPSWPFWPFWPSWPWLLADLGDRLLPSPGTVKDQSSEELKNKESSLGGLRASRLCIEVNKAATSMVTAAGMVSHRLKPPSEWLAGARGRSMVCSWDCGEYLEHLRSALTVSALYLELEKKCLGGVRKKGEIAKLCLDSGWCQLEFKRTYVLVSNLALRFIHCQTGSKKVSLPWMTVAMCWVWVLRCSQVLDSPKNLTECRHVDNQLTSTATFNFNGLYAVPKIGTTYPMFWTLPCWKTPHFCSNAPTPWKAK